MKYFFIIVLLLSTRANAQPLTPAQVIRNGSFTASDLWLLDPDSLRGNYPGGNVAMVLNNFSNSTFGIQIDSLKLRNDGDYIAVYDGSSASAPLLTKITRSSVTNWGVQSSGSVITIVFSAQYPYNEPSIYGWRLRIKSLQPAAHQADFLPIFQGSRNGNIQLADYDKDGDKDILLGGQIFRNDSKDDSLYVFDRIQKPLGNWRSANTASADFDGDGFKDVFIIGNQVTSSSSLFKAVIFKNNNGSFSEVSTSFPFISNAAVSVFDYNGDGKPDIAYTGGANGVFSFKLYLNNGNFNFVETPTNLPGLADASMSWLDFDKDGDMDVVMNGYNTTRQPMRLFVNNNNVFTDAQLVAFSTSGGEVRFADINGDGNPDIVNTGVNTPGNVDAVIPEILFNNGNGTFTRKATNLPAIAGAHHDWADYDGDGDLDMLVSGGEYGTTIKQYAAVFKNNGNGNFSKISLGDPVSISSVKWVDFNKDGKWDVFVAGRDLTPSALYKNMGADSFQVSTYPFAPYKIQGVALAEDFTNDGFIDLLFAGEIKEENCDPVYSSTLIRSLGWRVFPTVKLTKVADLNVDPGGNGSQWPYWRWGDVDNDGRLDVLLTHDPSEFTGGSKPLKIFKNNGNNKFTVMYEGYVGQNSMNDQVGVVDIDNDGINELFIVPNNLYRWNGTGFTTLYEDKSFSRAGNTSYYSYFDFADYDKDGYTDVAISQFYALYILKNNGKGRFVPTLATQNGSNHKFLKWADFDNDGDLDLLTSNAVFENTSFGGFRYRDAGLINKDDNLVDWNGHSGVADFNNDGYLDIFSINYNSFIKPASLFYNQQGKLFFENKPPANFFNYNGDWQGAEAFDIDNDGDNDIICSGGDVCSYSCIYLNNYNIRNTVIFLRTQNASEEYVIGSTYPVSWTGNNLSNSVNIELSVDSGSTWSQIVTNAPTTTFGGNYNWQVKNIRPSRTCLIRIKDSGNNNVLDVSDKVFAIVPEILKGTVTSPASMCSDSSFNVTFSSSNAPVGAGIQLWESTNGSAFTAVQAKVYNGVPVSFPINNNNSSAIKKYFVQITYPQNTGIIQSYSTDTVTTGIIKLTAPVIETNSKKFVVSNVESSGDYTWQFLADINTWKDLNPVVIGTSYVPNKTGTYRVKLSKDGCTEYSNSIAVSIDSGSANNPIVYLYPNPTTGKLTLDSLSGNWITLDIVTADVGQRVASFNLANQSTITINLVNLKAGIYIAVLRNKNGDSVYMKFIKI